MQDLDLKSEKNIDINNKYELIGFTSIKSKKPMSSFYLSNILLRYCIENRGLIDIDKVYKEMLRIYPEYKYKRFCSYIFRLTVNTKEFIRRRRTTCPLFYKVKENELIVLHPNSLLGEYACKLKYELLYKDKISKDNRKDFEYYIEKINNINIKDIVEPKYLSFMRNEYMNDDNVLIDFKVFAKRIFTISDLIHLKNTILYTKDGVAVLDYENIYAKQEREIIQRETGKKVELNEMFKGRKGYVYIVKNKYIPGLVKIGRTHRKNINLRINELSNTNVPGTYELVEKILTIDAVYLEKLLHTFYKNKNESKEFFKLDEDEVEDVIKTAYIYK